MKTIPTFPINDHPSQVPSYRQGPQPIVGILGEIMARLEPMADAGREAEQNKRHDIDASEAVYK